MAVLAIFPDKTNYSNVIMSGNKKTACRRFFSMRYFELGWLMGLEPTTTGITIQDSTN